MTLSIFLKTITYIRYHSLSYWNCLFKRSWHMLS